MTKDLSKSIMKHSRLRNKFDRQDRNISKKYNTAKLLLKPVEKSQKKKHFVNIDVNFVSDSKMF